LHFFTFFLCLFVVFQVLVEFGESRKIITFDDDHNEEVISLIREKFNITDTEIIIQIYDKEWGEFIDWDNHQTNKINDKAKLRVIAKVRITVIHTQCQYLVVG